MTDLSREASQLLRDARRRLKPDARELQAGREALLSRLAKEHAREVAQPERASGARRATRWLHRGARRKIALAVVIGLASNAYMLHKGATKSIEVQPAVATWMPPAADGGGRATPAGSASVLRPISVAANPVDRPDLHGAPQPGPRRSRRKPVSAAADGGEREPDRYRRAVPLATSEARSSAEPSKSLTLDGLAREVALIRAARAAANSGEHERVLAILAGYEQYFPRGVLNDERLAMQARAQCALGRIDAARATARSLAQQAPRSPYLAQIQQGCSVRHAPPPPAASTSVTR